VVGSSSGEGTSNQLPSGLRMPSGFRRRGLMFSSVHDQPLCHKPFYGVMLARSPLRIGGRFVPITHLVVKGYRQSEDFASGTNHPYRPSQTAITLQKGLQSLRFAPAVTHRVVSGRTGW
jgi:hypothetical protein